MSLALGLGLLALATPTLAQTPPAADPAPLLLHPAPERVGDAVPGAVLVPPAVFGGAGYGYSGHGYYYDGPGEGPLLTRASTARTAPRRAR